MKLKELALRLGLSQTTVSRALNDYPEVSERTRARVKAAAREFDYRPNPSARSLATGRSGRIGMVMPAERNLLAEPIFAEFLAGIAEFIAEHNIDLTIHAARAGQVLKEHERIAQTQRLDGLLVSSPTRSDERIAMLAKIDFPFIVHGRSDVDVPYAWLDIDNRGAFADATRLLLDLGHRRIALINAEATFTFAHDREAGMGEALAARGLQPDPALICNGPMTEEFGYTAGQRLLAARPRPSALLVSNTFSALGAIRALHDAGLEAGRDLSLIAHDDGLSYLRPERFREPLTTTESPIREAGFRVAEMLHQRIAGTPVEQLQCLWRAKLVVRASTGPPARR